MEWKGDKGLVNVKVNISRCLLLPPPFVLSFISFKGVLLFLLFPFFLVLVSFSFPLSVGGLSRSLLVGEGRGVKELGEFKR